MLGFEATHKLLLSLDPLDPFALRFSWVPAPPSPIRDRSPKYQRAEEEEEKGNSIGVQTRDETKYLRGEAKNGGGGGEVTTHPVGLGLRSPRSVSGVGGGERELRGGSGFWAPVYVRGAPVALPLQSTEVESAN